MAPDACPWKVPSTLASFHTSGGSGGGASTFLTGGGGLRLMENRGRSCIDRKSTRLNSSHLVISYAVFCLKKKKKRETSWSISASSYEVIRQLVHRIRVYMR